MISNYLMNRVSTFKGWKEQKSGFGRYMAMGIGTLFLDMGLLVLFVRLWGLPICTGCGSGNTYCIYCPVYYCQKLGMEEKIAQEGINLDCVKKCQEDFI